MDSFSVWHWLVVLAIIVFVIGQNWSGAFDKPSWIKHGQNLAEPVYSAETIDSKEAEFIGDKLPVQFSRWFCLVIVLVIAVVVYFTWA